MKKNAIIASLLLSCAATRADLISIAVSWESTGTYFYFEGGNPATYPGDYLPADAYHVLIWSPTAPPTTDYALAGTGIGANEVILWDSLKALRSGDTREVGGIFDYTKSDLIFSDSDVGGTIANGYVYSRIFAASTVSAGTRYYQSPVYLSPVLTPYDSANPESSMAHATAGDSNLVIPDIQEMRLGGSNIYQAIPEPGTIALSLAALGAMAYRQRRKRNRRAA